MIYLSICIYLLLCFEILQVRSSRPVTRQQGYLFQPLGRSKAHERVQILLNIFEKFGISAPTTSSNVTVGSRGSPCFLPHKEPREHYFT